MKFSKSQNNRNFPKGLNHGKPWQKNRMFSRWYFLIKLSQMRLFFDIVDRKECFLNQKSEILKKLEKSKFSAWLGLSRLRS